MRETPRLQQENMKRAGKRQTPPPSSSQLFHQFPSPAPFFSDDFPDHEASRLSSSKNEMKTYNEIISREQIDTVRANLMEALRERDSHGLRTLDVAGLLAQDSGYGPTAVWRAFYELFSEGMCMFALTSSGPTNWSSSCPAGAISHAHRHSTSVNVS